MRSFLYLCFFLILLLFITACTPAKQPLQQEKPQEVQEAPQPLVENKTPQIPPLSPPISPPLIHKRTTEQRLQEAYDRLHTAGSGSHIRASFPDIETAYIDTPEGGIFPQQILPFTYYYSKEADTTFNICNIDLTVFICTGKMDHLISKGDIDSKRCTATPIYLTDPRLR